MESWMLYGATGYTGRLTVEAAVERGHRPLLAGRSEARLKPLADRYGLEYAAFSLDDTAALHAALERVELVLHDAGPYKFTAYPMLDACLATGTRYLDLTGEREVMEYTWSLHEQAEAKGILLMNAAGFDSIPTDCLAIHVASQIDRPTELELAFVTGAGGSGGTLKTMLEYLPTGGYTRRDGRLVPEPIASQVKTIRFPHRELTVMSRPTAELTIIYRSTGIPNISTYMAFPPKAIRLVKRWVGPVSALLRVRPLRRLSQALVGRMVDGPGERQRAEGDAYIYARVANEKGETAEGWLHTQEAYAYTAVASVMAVERVLDGNYRGALTPGQAFGPDFPLDIPSTTRYDSLPDQ